MFEYFGKLQTAENKIHVCKISTSVLSKLYHIENLIERLEGKQHTVVILNIGTDRSEQTVQTQIRLLLMEQSDQGLLCLLFCLHLLNTILHCKINCSNCRTIMVIISGVPILRIFTVYPEEEAHSYPPHLDLHRLKIQLSSSSMF